MDRCRECDPNTCDLVCLKNSSFVDDLAEIEGFELQVREHLVGVPAGTLPRYIPVIEHRSGREEDLEWPFVGLPLQRVVIKKGTTTRVVAETPDKLRAQFKLGANTKVLLRGTGPDGPLERYWQYSRISNTAEALGQLGLTCAITPNYSHFLDDPRPTHLANIKRSVLVATDMSRAGVPVMPYIVAIIEQDYRRWETFLREQPNIGTIVEEFGTGLSRHDRGVAVLDRLAAMQHNVGRPLHLVAVAGAQYAQQLAERFDNFTIVDSTPFFKAVHRQIAQSSPNGIQWKPMRDADVGLLLYHNIDTYSRQLESVVRRRGIHLPIHP